MLATSNTRTVVRHSSNTGEWVQYIQYNEKYNNKYIDEIHALINLTMKMWNMTVDEKL